jgi:small-conductance mechanosensitive channel
LPTGIWGLSADLLRLSGKRHTLEDEIASTEELKKSARELRAPLVENLRNLIKQGDQLFAAADTATASQLAQQKEQLDALTAQFKQNSVAMLPLGKLNILLGIYETNLQTWRESIRDEFHDELRQLVLRLGVLLGLIGIVFIVGEIWRKTTFRYVHDVRRRYQFLLLRRVVMWTAIILIVVLAFATQLGSAVTFAGLLTAGVAVALQNVIVSVVGYFFLIGKYGVRVGDRVQISGVTGEVVDIGLVRLHLMELGGPNESQPSGRVVAFSNSIVFQPTAGLFKQIPGTNFIWHEVKLTLAAETEYSAARERITQAVNSALEKYREGVDAQRAMMERNLSSVAAADLTPKIRLHYSAAGIEAIIRFPVDLAKAAETDDHVLKELLSAMQREPKLKLLSAEMPVTKLAQS